MKNRKKCALGFSKPGSMETISDSLMQNELQNNMSNYEADRFALPLQMMNSMLASMLSNLDFNQQIPQEDIIRGNKETLNNVASRPLVINNNPLSGLTEKRINLPSFAFGGTVPIEAEGGEMIETPNGMVSQLKGPSHENGGIDLNIPQNSDIYSKRIKIDGKTIAQRKKSRELEKNRLEKRLSESKDPLLRKTLDRILEKHAIEDEVEKTIQNSLNKNTQKAAYGYIGEDDPLSFSLEEKKVALPNIDSPEENKLKDLLETNAAGIPTMGDALGIGGNIYQGVNALLSAKRNAATDLPNENPFLNYGKNAQKELENLENYLGILNERQKTDLRTARNASITKGRRSARGVNTMRAGDYATDEAFNKAFNDIDNNYIGQLASLAGQKSNLSQEIDRIVMGGEAQKDLANRQDKGARDSSIAKGKGDLARMISLTGKDVNKIKDRLVKSKLLNKSFDYLKTNVMTGDITQDKEKSGNINPYYEGLNPEDYMQQLFYLINGSRGRNYGGKR